MAINPIQTLAPNINSEMDFSPLAKLGEMIRSHMQENEAADLIQKLYGQQQQPGQQAQPGTMPQAAPPRTSAVNPNILSGSQSSPLDTAQYPVGPVGAPPMTPNARVAQGFGKDGYDSASRTPAVDALRQFQTAQQQQPDQASRFAQATSSIESASPQNPQGNYRAVGPPVKNSDDRAYGRYQVMGKNIPEWTKQYYGRELTPREFLLNNEAQDAVYQGKFVGEYVPRYGPTGAAKAWFAGPTGMNNPNATDGYTSIGDYADKFNRAAGISINSNSPGAGNPAQAIVQNLSSPNQPAKAAGIDSAQLAALYRNPLTRPIATAFLQKQLDPGTYEFMAAGDSVIRYNKTNGSYTVIATPQKLMTVPDKSGVLDPNTRQMLPGIGGDSEKYGELPANSRWVDPKNKQLGVEPMPGSTAEKVEAEVGARVGMGRSFLKQLPEIQERLDRGDLGIDNPGNHFQGLANKGVPGETARMLASGADALLRMMTGAGMPEAEAQRYVRRYEVDKTDTSWTLKSKVNQLGRELNEIMDTVSKGRGDIRAGGTSNPGTAGGLPQVGQVYHGRPYLGGPPNDPKSWGQKVS